jgi:hypothetical protein
MRRMYAVVGGGGGEVILTWKPPPVSLMEFMAFWGTWKSTRYPFLRIYAQFS